MCGRIAWRVKLLLNENKFYRVKKGQTLEDLAITFSLPARLIAAENGLTEEVSEGQVLLIPKTEGNLYTVRGGESKELLSGSAERYAEKNKTDCLYPAQKVMI